ncbi:MAG: ribosome biogenesis GTPase YlqF [Thermoanaerobacteraceae bacterium]|nr:ribosome biogenesis GTPase YlqF [Thermoanaerobacteraceae bacterium]
MNPLLNIQPYLKLVDVVVEVVEARLPASSRCRGIEEFLGTKGLIRVLNKADLALPAATQEWLEHYKEQGIPAVAVNSREGRGVGRLRSLLGEMARKKKERLSRQGRRGPLRAVIVGIPNVGKSSLINRLVGRAATRTGDRPGITRGPQWVRQGDGWELLDTPGVFAPPHREARTAALLTAVGCLPLDIVRPEEAVGELLKALRGNNLFLPSTTYGLKGDEPVEAVLEIVGRKRGFLLPGGGVDLERAALFFLREFRRGDLGKATLELPGDLGSADRS